MVEEQTRPSFQPIMQEMTMAVMTVVIRLRTAARVAPLKPARSCVLFERSEVRSPVLWLGLSKNETSWLRMERKVWARIR